MVQVNQPQTRGLESLWPPYTLPEQNRKSLVMAKIELFHKEIS